jgi:ubiquinone/menaquinone biosynthesis C-methylase UbiE
LDDLFIVKRFSIVIILMLIIGFVCYSSITNERLKRRTLEATLQYTTTFTKIILLVAINSFLLKYILRHYVLETLRLRGDEKVLNVACGTGFFLNGIASQLDASRGGMVTGIDIFETYVDKERVFPLQPVIRLADTIQNVVAMNNQSKAEVYNGFPFELEMLPSDTYDIVFISPTAILIQQKEIEAAFKQWKRVLKPGGKLVICDIFLNAGFTRKRLELSGWNHVHTGYPHWYLMAPVFLHSAIKRTSAIRTTDSSSPSLALASFTSRPGSSSSLEMRSSAGTDSAPNTNITIKESFELEDNDDDDEMKYKTLSPSAPAYMLPTSPFYWRVWYTLAIGIVAAIIGGIAIPISNFFFPGEKLANYF